MTHPIVAGSIQPGHLNQTGQEHTAGLEPAISNPSPPAPSQNLLRSRQERISVFAAPLQARRPQEFDRYP